MTHEEFQQELEQIPNEKLVEKANYELSKLCDTGGRSFTMCVPPKIDDTDIVLSEIIRRFVKLNATINS